MNMTMIGYACIFLVGVFVSAISQVLLKKAAMKKYNSFLAEYLNWRVIVAYGIFFGATLLSILAYKRIPLSMGPVLEATSYLYVFYFGVKLFGEHVNRKKLLALTLILAGILIYSLCG